MDASLDTDIVIHLYKSDKKDLLFSFCNRLYMHEYLLEHELKKKAIQVYQEFCVDIDNELISIICTSDLIEIGIKGLFEDYLQEYEYLFDRGEMYAIALAKAMGLVALLSDDTKEFGPHETLVKELIEDVIPFSFFELLFLKYLELDMNPEELLKEFESVNTSSMSRYPMKFKNKMLSIVRRFSKKSGTERDRQWIDNFCCSNNIDYKRKMVDLKGFLETL